LSTVKTGLMFRESGGNSLPELKLLVGKDWEPVTIEVPLDDAP